MSAGTLQRGASARRRACGLLLAGAAFVVVAGGDVRAQCRSPLASFGPIEPTNGFPAYYVDTSGLGLEACLDPTSGLCLITPVDLPNPAAPVSFPGNFPEEFFYWSGDADLA